MPKERKSSGTGSKMTVYSSHESINAYLQSALGVYNGITPPYASCGMIELHQVNGEFRVEMWYRNVTNSSGGGEITYRLDFPGIIIDILYIPYYIIMTT